MGNKRRQHSEQFKFKVALEASRGMQTINQIASQYNLHPNQVSNWKKQLLEAGPRVFAGCQVTPESGFPSLHVKAEG